MARLESWRSEISKEKYPKFVKIHIQDPIEHTMINTGKGKSVYDDSARLGNYMQHINYILIV